MYARRCGEYYVREDGVTGMQQRPELRNIENGKLQKVSLQEDDVALSFTRCFDDSVL